MTRTTLIEGRETIAALQLALDRSQARVKELAANCATMAERMAEANERADRLELALAATAALDAVRV